MRDTAQAYGGAGLAVLPARRQDKRPALGSWKQYQRRLPTEIELSAWFSNNHEAICIITGKISGNLEIIDFDNGGELFDKWYALIIEADADLADKLVIEQTPSGGYHVIYRCESEVCGNLKLAQRKTGAKVQTLIETRGEGGLFLCAPTAGYELIQGELTELPVLTAPEREMLLQLAWELNEHLPPTENQNPQHHPTAPDQLRPGDDYNARGDIRELLRSHGWAQVSTYGDNERWRRPDKTQGWSATLRVTDKVFYVFSSNAAPFEPDTAYGPFQVYTLLEHGGDFSRAAQELKRSGYGENLATTLPDDVDLSGLLAGIDEQCLTARDNSQNQAILERFAPKTLTQRFAEFKGLNPPIIHGLLREGETMNIIASPKVGKSWLASSLSISVASGLDWMGFRVEQGNVLHIDNELHDNTSTYRHGVVSDAMGVAKRLYSDNVTSISLRGKLANLNDLGLLFGAYPPGAFKLVIIDAFYRTLPSGTDENDNGAIAGLYNLIDRYASYLGCAFVLIHHASKGNQSGKSVTDVGAGAGSQSRAVDTHVILRPHEEDDITVMEAAVRSWPPLEPLALSWNWPLFETTDEVDTSALLGISKPKEKAREPTLNEFVDSCIGVNDPCSNRSIIYEARQQYRLSERKANDMLDLARDRGLTMKIRVGSAMKYIKVREGVTGDKGLLVAAKLAHFPDADSSEIAREFEVTRQYVNTVKRGLEVAKMGQSGGN